MMLSKTLIALATLGTLSLVPACGDDPDHMHENEEEVITTVTLTLTPMGGGAAVTASVNDPDGDGGAPPTSDPITLTAGTTYAVAVRFENRLETPPEDLTTEISDESDQHMIFFTGTAVKGPASDQASAPLTHTYGDMDANGLPIGLANTFVAAAGTGDLSVTLRHLPPVNNAAVKTAALPGQVKSGGFASIAGSSDAQATFMVTVR